MVTLMKLLPILAAQLQTFDDGTCPSLGLFQSVLLLDQPVRDIGPIDFSEGQLINFLQD